MKTNRIIIRPDRLNGPLVTIFAGKLSSAVWTVEGDIPDDIITMTIEVGRTEDSQTHQPRENFSAEAVRQDDGSFRCYLSPFHFPDLSESLQYHVMGVDDKSNPRWLGTGNLVIRKNPANGSPVVPPIIPPDTYVRNPVTGLYHKLTASVDEYGNIQTVVDSEGVEI